jgi:hypothetical protein
MNKTNCCKRKSTSSEVITSNRGQPFVEFDRFVVLIDHQLDKLETILSNQVVRLRFELVPFKITL